MIENPTPNPSPEQIIKKRWDRFWGGITPEQFEKLLESIREAQRQLIGPDENPFDHGASSK